MRLNNEDAVTFAECILNAFRDPEDRNNDFQKVEIETDNFDGTIMDIMSALLVIVQKAADMPDLTMFRFIYMINQMYFELNDEMYAEKERKAADERENTDRTEGTDTETGDLPEESR